MGSQWRTLVSEMLNKTMFRKRCLWLQCGRDWRKNEVDVGDKSVLLAVLLRDDRDWQKGYDEWRDLTDLKSFPEVKSMGINDGLDFIV